MELDTMHNRGFYEGKANDNKLLDAVVNGETTFTETLDRLVEGLGEPKEGIGDYIEMLGLLSGVPYCREMKEDIPYFKGRKDPPVAEATGMSLILATLVGGFFSPLLIVVAGWTSGWYFGIKSRQRTAKIIQEKKAKFLEPLYSTASRLDRDIGLNFMLEHFRDNRPRFGQTYSALGQEERDQVDERLYAFLGAGGMKNMDEIQLGDYLSGLLAPQPEGDA